ncbi:MAG: hypothetical protein IJL75_06295, partial [Eubacterium sp.]|nr:hypothetical protein [Eubacterium sp.]
MYKRNAQGLTKHLDFFIIEIISQQVAFLIACLFRIHNVPYTVSLYRNLAVVIALIDAIVMVFLNSLHNVLKRGYLKELKATLFHCLAVFGLATLYLFALQSGEAYSRIVLFLTFLLHILFGYGFRVLWRLNIQKRGIQFRQSDRTMLAVLHSESADVMAKRLNDHVMEGYYLVGVVLDAETDRKDIEGIPVVAALDTAAQYISQKWIDSVFIDCPSTDPRIAKLMDDCHQMALPVHYHVPAMSGLGEKQFVEKVGGSTVLTTSVNYATP